MWVSKIPDMFLSRCNFLNKYVFSLSIPTDYIKSSMRLKDFGNKQCTHGLTWRLNTYSI